MEKNYKELKTLNPKLPILIRECSGVEPQLWARYGIDHLKFNSLYFSFLFVSMFLHPHSVSSILNLFHNWNFRIYRLTLVH